MTQLPKIEALPREARLWLYVSSRPLTDDEASRIDAQMRGFAEDWSSHGRPVLGVIELADNRLLGIGALVPDADISGCGIDKSVHQLEELGSQMGVEWMAGLNIAYRNGDAIEVVPRPVFRRLVKAGEVDADTAILDLSLTTVGDLVDQGVERPLGESWHARVFRLPKAESA